MAKPIPIRIFDTTLRDGEQSPGATLNFQEKIEIARNLEALGVDIIEAGFPITSHGDFEAVRAISHELKRATVAGLARCVPRDVDRAGEALAGAHNPRIHVFCATSKVHRQHKLRMPIRKNIEKPNLALMLVIDKSGSMGGEKIELAKEAAKSAIELLGANDKVGVIAAPDCRNIAC